MTIATCKPNSTFPLKPLAAALLLTYAAGIHAAPVLDSGPGQANSPANGVTINTATPNEMIITQTNDRAVLNWESFSIDADELVRFIQPGTNSVVLNRVVGQSRSDILGQLQANGRVFLINPSGIVFGAGSEMNVGGLVASTLDLSPGFQSNDFRDGASSIELRGRSDAGEITNLAQITAKDIVLIAPNLSNSGSINAELSTSSPAGTPSVSMIAAREVTVNVSGSDLVLNVTAGHENAVINQLGDVLAQGGKIVLIANASGAVPSVINTAEVLQASEISIVGDQVKLTGSVNVGNQSTSLNVQANSIVQDAELLAGGAVQLKADTAILDHAGNDFTGPVDLAVTGDAVLQDSNNFLLGGHAGALTLNATDLTLNNLTAESLIVNADHVAQADRVVVNTTSILNADDVQLNHAQNDFGGDVDVQVSGQARLHDINSISIAGTAGELNVSAAEVNQHDVLVVANTTSVEANRVTLMESENDFLGNVNLLVSEQANLQDLNSLSVSGNVADVSLRADDVNLNGLTAEGLTVHATNVNQTAGVTVESDTILNARNIDLTAPDNAFNGHVNLVNGGAVSLTNTGNLQVSGRANELTLTASRIDQAAALVVDTNTTLNADQVRLNRNDNDFKGDLTLNVSGTTELTSIENLQVSGVTGSAVLGGGSIVLNGLEARGNLTLQAEGLITQSNENDQALTVLGNTRIDNADSVTLNNAGNSLAGVVTLSAAGTVGLTDLSGMAVQGSAGNVSLNSGASGQVMLNQLDANTLSVNAETINQSGALNISGSSTLTAEQIILQDGANEFGGVVNLTNSDEVRLTAAELLTLTGDIGEGVLAADTLRLNGLSVNRDLALGAGTVTQSPDIDRALRVQGATSIQNADSVILDNPLNDFVGTVTLNTSGSVNLADTHAIELQGQIGSLSIVAGSVGQLGALTVEDSSLFAADNVVLTNNANDFKGNLALTGNAHATLHDANTLAVSGDTAALTVSADNLEINNSLTVAGDLVIHSNRAMQTAALAVDGSTQIQHLENSDNSALVELNNTDNDFVGVVDVFNQANVILADRNNATVQGDAGNLTVRATTAGSGKVTLGELTANQLTVDAVELAQAGSIIVAGTTSLSADELELLDLDNDFQGVVDLDVTSSANLHDSNLLQVSGAVNNAKFEATTVTFDALNAAGHVEAIAGRVNQAGALSVAGTTDLQAASVELLNVENTLDGAVVLNVANDARLHSAGDLELAGTASLVSASAIDTLSVSSLNAQDIVLDAGQVQLNNFSTPGNLTLNGQNVVQTGALTVGGETTLGAVNVNLQNEANDFAGHVVLNDSGDVRLRDINNISLGGNTDSLSVQAGADVNQSATLVVNNGSTFAANNVNLSDDLNRFGGAVALAATQAATVHAQNNLSVSGTTSSLAAVAQETLELGMLTVGTLNATANEINQEVGGRVEVNGQANLTAQDVRLLNAQNDFKGTVNVQVTDQVDIADSNALFLQGSAAVVNTNVTGTLTAGNLQIDRGNLSATTIELNQLNVGDSALLNADLVTQTQAVDSGGVLTLQADQVQLDHADNDFRGNVLFDNARDVRIHDANNLIVGGQASNLSASATGMLTLGSTTANTLTLQADRVEQTAGLQTQGDANISAREVDLRHANNNFNGRVDLQVTDQAQLFDISNLTVEGEAGELNLFAAGNVTLGALEADRLTIGAVNVNQTAALSVTDRLVLEADAVNLSRDDNRLRGLVELRGGNNTLNTLGELALQGDAAQLNATASTISQADALTISGSSALQAQTVVLNNLNNDFQQVVNLDVSGTVTLQDRNNLQVSGQADTLNATAVNTLSLQNLSVESLNAQADALVLGRLNSASETSVIANTVTQTDAVTLGAQSSIQAHQIDLRNTANDFTGPLSVTSDGQVEITDANTLTLGDLNGSGTIDLTARNVNQTGAFNHSGVVDIDADSVQMENAANDFSGQLRVRADSAELVDANALNMTFSGQTLSVQSDTLTAERINASGDVRVVANAAILRDANNLSLQGDFGSLSVQANKVSQIEALTVSGQASITANELTLDNPANDFQGDVQLDVSGTTVVRDANTVSVSGQLNGSAQLHARAIVQANELTSNGSLLLQADRVELSNSNNNLNGVVRIEGASSAALSTQQTLRLEGVGLNALNVVAGQATLGELGQLQQLTVSANEIRQSAALEVLDQTKLQADRIVLNDASNDFAGTVQVQAQSAARPVVLIQDSNSLAMQGDDIELAATVQGDLNVTADDLVLGATQVGGNTQLEVTGALTQSGLVSLNTTMLKADQIALNRSGNQFNGAVQLDSTGAVSLRTEGHLLVNTGSSTGTLALDVGGDTNVAGNQVVFAESRLDGNLVVTSSQVSQSGRLRVQGDTQLNAVGGTVNLQNTDNAFQGTVGVRAEQTNLTTRGDLQLLDLSSRGGQLTALGRVLLMGNIEQTGGSLTFTASGVPRPLSSADIALLLPPALDVFSNKDAVNPLTGLGRITLAGPMIHQQAGQVVTASGALTQFNSPQNGSIVLTRNNQINGQIGVLAGQNYKQPFAYSMDHGASLFAVNNEVRLNVGAQGVEADVVAIRARGLATQGNNSVINARMPYNDLGVGTARSYAGLTLSIPLGGANSPQGGLATFGESSGTGQSAGSGAVRVEVGDSSRPGLGGFLTVLPFEGTDLLPGQVIYLAGPERPGTQAFFYDGARSLNRIPVVYNGTLLLSPQENAALTTAQGAVVLARQEQTRSVVRTENVAGKIINGVVAEVGPGRPATEGEGGAGKPSSCDAEEESLSCK